MHKSFFQIAFSFGLFISSLLISHLSSADTLDLSLSDQMVEIDWRREIGNAAVAELSYLHSEDNREDSDIVGVGLFITTSAQQFDIRMGGKLFYFFSKDIDSTGVSLGADANYRLTRQFFIGGSAFYSPDILTWGDFDNFIESDIKVGFKPANNASLYIAYRYLEGSQGKFDFEPYDGLLIGFAADF